MQLSFSFFLQFVVVIYCSNQRVALFYSRSGAISLFVLFVSCQNMTVKSRMYFKYIYIDMLFKFFFILISFYPRTFVFLGLGFLPSLFFLFFLFGNKQVDNGYVLKKLKVLLLPILKKDWYRMPSEDEVKDDVSCSAMLLSCTSARATLRLRSVFVLGR